MLLAHAGSFSWDEALMVLAPIAVLAGVLLYANTKLRRGLGDQLLDDDGDDAEAGRSAEGDGRGTDAPIDASAPTSDPSTSA